MHFKFKEISIDIGFWFAFTICYLLCVQRNSIIRMAVLFSILHESGHLLAYFFLHIKPKSIVFSLCGMTILENIEVQCNYEKERIIAFAGPLTNLVLFFSFMISYYCCDHLLYLKMAFVNFWIYSFNMLPIFALDGGRIMESFLLEYSHNATNAYKIGKTVSFLFIFILMAFGFWILIKSKYNYSLFILSIYFCYFLYKKC